MCILVVSWFFNSFLWQGLINPWHPFSQCCLLFFFFFYLLMTYQLWQLDRKHFFLLLLFKQIYFLWNLKRFHQIPEIFAATVSNFLILFLLWFFFFPSWNLSWKTHPIILCSLFKEILMELKMPIVFIVFELGPDFCVVRGRLARIRKKKKLFCNFSYRDPPPPKKKNRQVCDSILCW